MRVLENSFVGCQQNQPMDTGRRDEDTISRVLMKIRRETVRFGGNLARHRHRPRLKTFQRVFNPRVKGDSE